MSGVEKAPIKVPAEWDRTLPGFTAWITRFVRDVLAKGDVRNAIGSGVTISGSPAEVGTISVDATLGGLAALPNTAGLVEQTATDVFAIRAIGVGTAAAVPTRAHADARYEPVGTVAAHVAAPDPHTQYALEGASTYTGTLTGCTTAPTATLRWTQAGSLVTLYVPQLNATSNSTACTITGMPADIRPARAQRVRMIVQDNSVVVDGLLQIETNGTLTLYASIAAAAFNAGGTKGVELQSVTYSLA